MSIPAADKDGLAGALDALKARFGARLVTGEAVRAQHAHTLTYIPAQLPDGVVFPESNEEVAALIAICARERVPVIAFGAGTSLEGQLNAPMGGISADLSRFDKVIAVNEEDMDCTVQAGVTRKALNSYLRDTGLFFPVDPGADATLGGMAATGASGTMTVRYGTMRANVLNLTAVMADGSIVQTAKRARKSAAGYDLTQLLIGSEGTLGIITELTLRLHGQPEAVSAGVCAFKTVAGACQAVSDAIRMGLAPARIEFLDAVQVRACNLYSDLSLEEAPTLFLEFHGTANGVREAAQLFADIAQEHGGGTLHWSDKAEERQSLWAARHDAYWAAAALRPGADVFVTDACVPLSRLADCVAQTHEDIQQTGLLAPIVGHVGDGNFHVLALIDRDNRDDVDRISAFVDRLVARALKMEGTSTGEHGIGQGKQRFLRQEHGQGVEIMGKIKAALDPHNILNPGKIIEMP